MTTYIEVSVTERLPKIANENYLTVSERGIKTGRFFNGIRFESASYEGEITHWLEEYRSQASDLPSDEECNEIAFRKLLLTGRTESEEIQDRKLIIEGLTIMRSIASPLLASRDARIKELEEALKISEEIVSELNRGYNRFM